MDSEIPQFVAPMYTHSLLDVLLPRRIEPRNARVIHPMGRDNAWQTEENIKRWDSKRTANMTLQEHREASRLAMQKHRASRPEKRANKILMDAVMELLRGKEHYGVALAERLGVNIRKMGSLLSYMRRRKMICRNDERKPWRVAP